MHSFSINFNWYFFALFFSYLHSRRLPVVMVRLKMVESLRDAVRMVEQGHIRVGPQTVTDPAYLVTRPLEDYITWVNDSSYKRKIMKYNDKLDDFDLMLWNETKK